MSPVDPVIRIRFGLTPLERIRPWSAERPVPHWFGLTDGWYCLDLGGHEVLRYSERTVGELRGGREGGPPHPYVDYYVVRLWEDLIALVSGALEPVPQDLVDVAATLSPEWEWRDTPEAEAALDWHSAGHLYTDYLRVAPHIRCWRTVVGTDDTDDTVTVAWEHRPDPEGVIEFASPRTGRAAMPTGEFLAAVTEFDRALLAAMDRRIGALEESGPVPGAEADMEQLRREHRDRATWLPRARARERGTDWDAVRIGARLLLTPGLSGN
ncbi:MULTISPECIES: DUF5984 family protein [unclassified Streptomyces]|uniref:DUF5984 family protein n=1 Tax=unclassified Streptomyces TaxID=2593676 RepID=UPI003804FD32